MENRRRLAMDELCAKLERKPVRFDVPGQDPPADSVTCFKNNDVGACSV
jgi:hypothetical protein